MIVDEYSFCKMSQSSARLGDNADESKSSSTGRTSSGSSASRDERSSLARRKKQESSRSRSSQQDSIDNLNSQNNLKSMKDTNARRESASSAIGSIKNVVGDDGHVQVAVRCRPLSEKELAFGYQSIVEIESDKRIVIHDVSAAPGVQLGTRSDERRNVSRAYDFDMVFDERATQASVYSRACEPIVASVLEGYNGTIFAYGQTGTGKTYTMNGESLKPGKKGVSKTAKQQQQQDSSEIASGTTEIVEPNAGMIHRSFNQIFQHVAQHPEVQFLIRASYLEIYQEQIRDLLRRDKSSQRLELHERPDIGVYVKDLTWFVCKTVAEIERVLRVGNQNRIVGATDMNEHSSRSHAIFMITVEQQQQLEHAPALLASGAQSASAQNEPMNSGASSATPANTAAGAAVKLRRGSSNKQQVIKVGKLNLVDLAGSERQRKTNSFGQRQRESIKINLSLSALGNVINSLMKLQQQQQQQQQSNNPALSSAAKHTPHRDSKLTRLLQDSLGGNAKTLMIANIGPASYNNDETINTLNYASRARCIKNKPRLNEDPKDALLRELQCEIDLLRSKLAGNEPTSERQQSGDKHAYALELQELRRKLSSLEGKLLNSQSSSGGLDENLLKGLTREQESELERQRSELANQADRERAIRDELERRIEAELEARQTFESAQQELDSKHGLLRQVLTKIKAVRAEIDDSEQAFRIELLELEQLYNVLQRELKLKCLVMDNFVPNLHVDILLPTIVYESKRNVCHIQRAPQLSNLFDELASGGCNYLLAAASQDNLLPPSWRADRDILRASSEFERMSNAIYPNNIRYKHENLVKLKRTPLIISRRSNHRIGAQASSLTSSQDSAAHKQAPERMLPPLQALLDEALSEREPDVVI